MKRTCGLGVWLVMGVLGTAFAASCTVTEAQNDDDDGGTGSTASTASGSGPMCSFESVIPSMTCGDNAGMVCPASVYCDACATDVVVDCTCTDSGTDLGHQFVCDDCAMFCSSGNGGAGGTGGAGGSPVLSPDEQLCADFCNASASAPPCAALPGCESGCLESLTAPSCSTEARAFFTCGTTTTWTCEGETALPDDCFEELSTYSACTEG